MSPPNNNFMTDSGNIILQGLSLTALALNLHPSPFQRAARWNPALCLSAPQQTCMTTAQLGVCLIAAETTTLRLPTFSTSSSKTTL